MPKHAVPKKKTAKSTSKKRYGAFKTGVLKKLSNKTNLVPCASCGQVKINHQVCKECGQYKGQQVIDMGKKVKKVTKIKA
ncbi:MAG: 50S ribosomal protein L32 [Patescibacteria group bacterium]|nr:50S ribosomal protein L32 [Patescibacteria group bacterium]